MSVLAPVMSASPLHMVLRYEHSLDCCGTTRLEAENRLAFVLALKVVAEKNLEVGNGDKAGGG